MAGIRSGPSVGPGTRRAGSVLTSSQALAIRGLTKRYGDILAVDALDLTVDRGVLYGFLGPNGAGKTTTIRMILRLIFPTSGSVELLGEPVFGTGRGAGQTLERAGAIVEEPAFWKYLSGRRNLRYFARAGRSGANRESRLRRVDDVLDVVGLRDAADKRVKAYSQGMRQRLGIALALLGAPEVLILDEPTNGLDPQGMREIRKLLRRLADEGTTVFVSSHLLSEVEAMCDRVGVLAHGRLVADGPPSDLRTSGNRFRIQVDDVVAAHRILTGVPGVHVEVDGSSPYGTSPYGSTPDGGPGRSTPRGTQGTGELRVRLTAPMTPARVNSALVSGGIGVSGLAPDRASLEDVFVSLVEGADVPR